MVDRNAGGQEQVAAPRTRPTTRPTTRPGIAAWSSLSLGLAGALLAGGCDTNTGPGQNEAALRALPLEQRCIATLPPFGHFRYGDKWAGDPYAPPDGSILMANSGNWCVIRFEHWWNSLQIRPPLRVEVPPGTGEVQVGSIGMVLQIAYRPRPGFVGSDIFSVHIGGGEPDIIPVRVQVTPG